MNGVSMQPGIMRGDILYYSHNEEVNSNSVVVVSNPLRVKNKDINKYLTVKRCVAMPGDTFQISYKLLYINGKEVKSDKLVFNRRVMLFTEEEFQAAVNYGLIHDSADHDTYLIPVSESLNKKISREGKIRNINNDILSPELSDKFIFPYSESKKWNRDHFGPLVVPKCGMKIRITYSNVAIYRFILNNFEHARIEQKNGILTVNGKNEPYMFKNDYYFVLNDYRDDTSDSRTFGFVPAHHIAGVVKYIIAGRNENGNFDLKKIFTHVD